MKFENALIELRKGKKIQMSSRDWIIFSLEDEHGYCLGVNDFVNEDWQTLEEPGKTFPEVFEAFKEGKCVRRKQWNIDVFMKNDKQVPHARHNTSCIPLFSSDLLANDWEIIS